MDPVIVVVAIVAVVAVTVIFAFRDRLTKFYFRAFGSEFTAEGKDPGNPRPPEPAIKLGSAVSRRGHNITEDRTGRGIEATKLEAEGDNRTIVSQPDENPRPKA